MAYKFQLGAATMSGSLTQEGDVIVKDGGITVPNIGTIGTVAVDDLILFNADGDITVKDGTYDFIIASHDGSNGLKLGADLVTASGAELNFLDGSTAGTVVASKAIVADANKDVSEFRNLRAVQLSASTNIVIGAADINEADLEKIDGITNGTVAANKALVADASTLVKFANGSKSGLFTAVDTDNAIQLGATQNASIYYNTAQMEGLVMAVSSSEGGVVSIVAGEAQNAVINLTADEHDDAGDMWEIACQASNDKFSLSNDIASKGNQVEHFSITPNGTVANSTAAVAGHLTVGHDLTVTGDLIVNGTTTTVNSTTIEITGAFAFDGTTPGGNKTTLNAVDPTANATIRLPAMSAGTYHVPVLDTVSTVAISSTPAELNLLDGTGKSTSSITIDPTDAFIIIDGNTTKQIPASNVKTFAAGAVFEVGSGNVAVKDNTNELVPGYNYFADLGGAEACNLPNNPDVGFIIHLKAPSNCSVTNTLTVNRQGSDTIDGEQRVILESPHAAVTFVCVAANTYKIF